MRRRELLVAATVVMAASPVRAQKLVPVIGYLSGGSLESDNIQERLAAFRAGLSETGFVEGQNVAIDYRWAEGQYDRLPDLANDLVNRGVNVIVAVAGAPTAFAAKAATLQFRSSSIRALIRSNRALSPASIARAGTSRASRS
jgi:putative ABC transport system substrate-binding protein